MVNSIADDFLKERYFKEGEDWETLCCRVAEAHAKNSTEFTNYFEMLNSCDALPNSPTLMNSGTDMGYLSACNVVPVPDDLEGIMEAVKSSAIIQKHGGGVGFTFSELRPAGDLIKKTGGTSSGVVSFLKMFDMVGQVIKQGGKRRSANMGLLHYNHPDILRWIHAKDVEDLSSLNLKQLKQTHPEIAEWIHTKNVNNSLSSFNLSVALTDEFFEKVKNDEHVVFINPRTGEPFPAYDPLLKSSLDFMPAKVLLNRIAKLMWKSGEPGVIFWDTMQNDNPAKGAVGVDGVNPCGESPLPNWGSCILGSINLYNHLKERNGVMVVDYDKIALTTITMTKFLNAVIDNNVYPLSQMKEVALDVRQIGIGIMGFADVLGTIGVRYGSMDSMQIAYLIMSTIQNAAAKQSRRLAFTHGPYPAWEHAERKNVAIRNATLTSIAPTGSISFIANVSSGLEPFFKIAYMMNRDDKTPTFVVARSFMDDLKKHGLEDVLGKMVSNDYTPTQMVEKGLLPESFSHYVTANEVTPVEHVKMQAEFQKYVDLAISKTVNLPHDATVEDIENVIMSAYEQRCKGLTVFRDNCFRDAFLTEIACSSCGSTNVEHKEGCMTCSDCGVSLCSVG